MSSNISYLTVADAIRANEATFFAAVEKAVTHWVETTKQPEISLSLFSYDVADLASETQRVA